MLKIKCSGISYDTDGEEVDLPETLVVKVERESFQDDPDSVLSDAISDATGYCVFGFEYEIDK